MVIEGESGREWVLSSIANNAQPLFAFTAVIQAVRQASRSIRLFIVGRAWAWAYRVFSASPNNSKSFIYAPTSYIWATLDLPLSAFFFICFVYMQSEYAKIEH